ncbi:MAG: 4Fe-4S binding protein [Paludibacter sp.]|jgi:MinD superfamily P-loop ATPase|nr:4Fe-4S binding protein [Paludibacter sp.]
MFWNNKKFIANVIENKCTNCRCCVRICRHHALHTAEVNGKVLTFVNRPERCTGCGKCAINCPNNAIELIDKYC